VAADEMVAERTPFLNTRMVEWSVVAALILTLVVAFMYQMRVVQRQAELAAVRTTLGALRTALVLQHLQQQGQAHGVVVAGVQHNPFELLARHPANYVGEVAAVQTAAVSPGSWVFGAQCVCVGYVPYDATEFDSPSGDVMAWYHVTGTPAGPLQMTPREAYKWQGEVMN
jgi:hypothetical protein